MTLPASGAISLNHVNTEVGVASGTSRSLEWVKANTWFNYSDLKSLYGLAYYTPRSSRNAINRLANGTTTNCGGAYGSGDLQCTITSQCSYSHGTHLQANCNCNCNYSNRYNCNCDCNCNCSCFPAGSMVLMADGSWKAIELIEVGEKLQGATGINTVYEAYKPKLGSRRLFSFENGSLIWSEEHPFWVKRGKEQFLWTVGKECWKESVIIGLKDNEEIWTSEKQEEEFAHLSGWKKHTPVEVLGDLVNPKLQLYQPRVDGDHMIIVNGYLVSGGTNGFDFDYRTIQWAGLK